MFNWLRFEGVGEDASKVAKCREIWRSVAKCREKLRLVFNDSLLTADDADRADSEGFFRAKVRPDCAKECPMVPTAREGGER